MLLRHSKKEVALLTKKEEFLQRILLFLHKFEPIKEHVR